MGLFDSIKTTGIVLSAFADGFKTVGKENKLMKKIDELNESGAFNEEEKALIKEYKQIEKQVEKLYKNNSVEEAGEKQKALDEKQEKVFSKLFDMLQADSNTPEELKKMLTEYVNMKQSMGDKMAGKVASLVAEDAGAKTKEEKAALKEEIGKEMKNIF